MNTNTATPSDVPHDGDGLRPRGGGRGGGRGAGHTVVGGQSALIISNNCI